LGYALVGIATNSVFNPIAIDTSEGGAEGAVAVDCTAAAMLKKKARVAKTVVLSMGLF